jgi:hypothetical protein
VGDDDLIDCAKVVPAEPVNAARVRARVSLQVVFLIIEPSPFEALISACGGD